MKTEIGYSRSGNRELAIPAEDQFSLSRYSLLFSLAARVTFFTQRRSGCRVATWTSSPSLLSSSRSERMYKRADTRMIHLSFYAPRLFSLAFARCKLIRCVSAVYILVVRSTSRQRANTRDKIEIEGKHATERYVVKEKKMVTRVLALATHESKSRMDDFRCSPGRI